MVHHVGEGLVHAVDVFADMMTKALAPAIIFLTSCRILELQFQLVLIEIVGHFQQKIQHIRVC